MSIKEKAKKVWAEHKGKIIFGATVIGLGLVAVVTNNKEQNATLVAEEKVKSIEENSVDYGKDILMNFVDEESGEVLWKEQCTELYMNQMKECGMQYEATRKLNGLE